MWKRGVGADSLRICVDEVAEFPAVMVEAADRAESSRGATTIRVGRAVDSTVGFD